MIAQVVPTASFGAAVRDTAGLGYLATGAVALLLLLYLAYIILEARHHQKLILKENERLLEAQVMLSNTDKLTSLLNRRAYEDDLATYPSVPTERDFVYVSVDVNGLKAVNDSLGHAAGDELLSGASRVLKQRLGSYGRVYRVGGDEFAAMIFADEEHLTAIRTDLNDTMLAWHGATVHELSMSFGFAARQEFPAGTTVAELAKAADKRMYEAKAAYYRSRGVDRRGQQTAFAALCSSYTKILRINLTTDVFHIIYMDMSEKTSSMGFSQHISVWLRNFGLSGSVHPDDLDHYLAETDPGRMKAYFAGGGRHLSIFYRRNGRSGFRQAMMELIPADDYQPDNQTLYLYVKDIEHAD